jgi:putative membrane protein
MACPYGFMGMGGYGWIFQLLIFIGFFLIVWWLLKGTPGLTSGAKEKPLDILKRRLARGEITKKEYEILKKEIE